VEDEFVADALTALTVLRTRPEVDPKYVFVLGHSLGALMAPEIAERSGDVAGLVLLAAPGRPLLELTLEQFRINGVRASELAQFERQIKALPTLPPDEHVNGMSAGYWQDLARRDEIAIARKLEVKILYLRGALDRNVFALDQEKWVRAFAGNPRFEAVTVPRLSHALVPAAPDLTGDEHVPDALIARIADFVRPAAPAAP
jgi:pimeloyl-ACP methyl ester carboxylesterase